MKKGCFWIIILLFLTIYATSAKADMYSFTNITNNGNEDLAGQLGVALTDVGSNQVLFTFYNNVGIASSICDIYFDDEFNLLSEIIGIENSSGVSFSEGANPSNLPGSQPFDFNAHFSVDSDSPVSSNGINFASESLGISFNLSSGKSFDDILSGIESASLRFGLHVQAIGSNEGSDSYINDYNPVPVPGSVLLGIIGVSVAGIKLRKYT